ncbi:MAG: Nif3-like dinuclear metal center hexameric protein [Chitinophagaceae bacterium]|nr:Nif3-like dinuclear metal center hexameric protein [Chitinophagaceae bacterium]
MPQQVINTLFESMPRIKDLISALEQWAPPALQENYDNAGLIAGDAQTDCTGVLCSLDCTEAVIDEAVARGCNLVVAHHPIVFQPLKRLTGGSYAERTLIKAIRQQVAIYAVHTNLDNVLHGVNHWMADQLGLRPESRRILQPKAGLLAKLYTYVPVAQADAVLEALYAAGAGHIGQYVECSFSTKGTGSFRPLPGTHPAIGQAGGPRERVAETKIEVLLPLHRQQAVLAALKTAHPYETVAYELIKLENEWAETGSGLLAELPGAITETELLHRLQQAFGLQHLRHTAFTHRPIRTVALCGGAGSFLTRAAIAAGADAFITADVKYHEFFDADGRLLLADIGHFESEQHCIAGLAGHLQAEFPTFAVLKAEVVTNPVHYFSRK